MRILPVIFLSAVIAAALFFVLRQSSEIISPQSQKSVVAQEDDIPYSPEDLHIDTFFDGKLNDFIIDHPDQVWTMIATGDIIPARSVNAQTIAHSDFRWAFLHTGELVADADITFANLETPIIKNCPITHEGMSFCGDARHVEGLVYAGIDIVNLGNNHAGNKGVEGIQETIQHLHDKGILAIGAFNNPQYITVKGIKIAFLGYDDIEASNGISRAEFEDIKSEIQEASHNADMVVVQFHWGIEYVSQPSDRQRELGKFAIDSGADIVIGNHPHWIQPVEIYRNKLITYAHGNYIFDQMWSQKTREGVIGKYYFYSDILIDAEYTPVEIVEYGQAKVISDPMYKKNITDSMYAESKLLQTKTR